jgi:hypothetical protein
LTPHAEAERLAGESPSGLSQKRPDKNGSRCEEMISLRSSTVVQRKLNLVAGVVTGGGGKATTTKTKRHAFFRKRKVCANESVPTGDEPTAGHASEYKSGTLLCVHAEFAGVPQRIASAVFRN